MIKQFLISLENPKWPLLGPNYWILKKIGLLLPENKLSNAAYIFLHELVTFFILTQYMELYVIRSDLDLVLTNLKISMLSTVCIVKTNTFIFWQSSWRGVLNYINEADKYERLTCDTVRSKILDSYTKYCRNITYFYWFLVFTTFVTTTHSPLLRFLSSSMFREELRNGTELFPHIFSSWMPFDKYHTPGSWITVVWHAFMCAYGAAIMAAYDTSLIVILVFFGGKLDLLRERCKLMLGSGGFGVSNEHAAKMIRELCEVHILLTKYSRLLNSLLSPVMFVYVIMCALMLCASAFQLTSAPNATQKLLMAEYFVFGIAQLFLFCWHSNDVLIKVLVRYSRLLNSLLSPVMFVYVIMCALMLCASAFQLTSAPNATQKLLMAEYFVFGIAQLFLFCWHSNDVLIKSQDVIYGPYESEWWAANALQRKGIHLLAGQFRTNYMFTAGPFTNLTLPTFISILKGAYSYYTLLNKGK